MYTDFNASLRQIKEKCRKQQKWQECLIRAERQLQEANDKARRLSLQLNKEKKDVERLESFSLSNLFYTVTGRKLEKLDKEKQEAAAAHLKYREAKATTKDLEAEVKEYAQLLASVRGCEEEYASILKEKERLIYSEDSYWSQELYELTEREAEVELTLKEYDEAIRAGEAARDGLYHAQESLNSAKSWSTFDMIGGGMISTAIKHSRIDDAKASIHDVQQELRHFQEELLDIKEQFQADIEIGGFLTFADYFFDGIIVDWAVHGKISESHKQVSEVLDQVNDLLNKLTDQSHHLQFDLDALQQQRNKMIENI
ncbi:hypothetical protein SAMN05421736_104170 [Evansella caseinilytica]|uniref:Uncharacterized protein n=1 Tax=Evansella caseinilytica TaxID=1503961 RepID=A0A1H3NQW0_9BACI|nr:hypothetical protein [Evansella caseinilytica]SDY91306.1 hypothetical protein SAMN05421736_104170 [Evansella caseinilytica]